MLDALKKLVNNCDGTDPESKKVFAWFALKMDITKTNVGGTMVNIDFTLQACLSFHLLFCVNRCDTNEGMLKESNAASLMTVAQSIICQKIYKGYEVIS